MQREKGDNKSQPSHDVISIFFSGTATWTATVGLTMRSKSILHIIPLLVARVQ
jgi:hypothetical protein